MGRRIAMYLSWDRSAEASAPLGVLDNRFPALFELRRLFWPHHEALADPERYDQGIEGFLQQILLENFRRFTQLAQTWTGHPVQMVERRSPAGEVRLDASWLSQIDTLIIISFDGPHSRQSVTPAELTAVEEFLDDPAHAVFVCPHHDIGDTNDVPAEDANHRRQVEFDHHGDRAIPGQQRFGGFALSLMRGLELPIRNRFGLRPARQIDGAPAPVELTSSDRHGADATLWSSTAGGTESIERLWRNVALATIAG